MNKIIPLFTALALGGCSMYQPPDILEQSNTRVVIADKEVGQSIRISDTHIDHQRVCATILNRGETRYKLKVRFYWYGKKNLEIAPFFSDIQEITLSPQQKLDIVEALPNTDIVDFRVEIKRK